MSFSYEIKSLDKATVITFKGNLIEKSQAQTMVDDLDILLGNGNSALFIIDMQDMKFMNSTGLNVLIGLLTKARNHDGDAIVCNLPAKIKELLLITKLSAVFTLAENVEEALSKVSEIK